MTRYAEWPAEGRIITIQLTSSLVVLSEAEILSLLSNNPVIWEQGLKRGKAYLRAQERLARGDKDYNKKGSETIGCSDG